MMETSPADLFTYIQPAENTAGQDIVVWYIGSLHHIPQYEDGPGALNGVSPVQWLEFTVRPRARKAATVPPFLAGLSFFLRLSSQKLSPPEAANITSQSIDLRWVQQAGTCTA